MPTIHAIYPIIKPYTLLEREKFAVISRAINETWGLDGDMAEFGVYKGGISLGMAIKDPRRQLYLFDTFEGIPDRSAQDEPHGPGDFGDTSYTAVKTMLKNQRMHGGYPMGQVTLVQGIFPESAEHAFEFSETPSFSFVHVDADHYQSTYDAIEWFYPKMVKGGIMIFDDWEWQHCPGVKKALLELQPRFGYQIEVTRPTQAQIRA